MRIRPAGWPTAPGTECRSSLFRLGTPARWQKGNTAPFSLLLSYRMRYCRATASRIRQSGWRRLPGESRRLPGGPNTGRRPIAYRAEASLPASWFPDVTKKCKSENGAWVLHLHQDKGEIVVLCGAVHPDLQLA